MVASVSPSKGAVIDGLLYGVPAWIVMRLAAIWRRVHPRAHRALGANEEAGGALEYFGPERDGWVLWTSLSDPADFA